MEKEKILMRIDISIAKDLPKETQRKYGFSGLQSIMTKFYSDGTLEAEDINMRFLQKLREMLKEENLLI